MFSDNQRRVLSMMSKSTTSYVCTYVLEYFTENVDGRYASFTCNLLEAEAGRLYD